MFFDCTGLLAGLAASVITKWKANDKFSYGYVRAEVIAGFVNSLFLLFVAFFIMSEAVERAIEPPEVSDRFFHFYSSFEINTASDRSESKSLGMANPYNQVDRVNLIRKYTPQ